MIKLLKHTAAFMSLLFTESCNSIDLNYVKSKTWVYEDGFRIGAGDFMLFTEDQSIFSLHKDTIFYIGKPAALIKELQQEKFTLIITSIDTKETGEYLSTEEALH